jgi:hypothetical protein
MNDMKSKDTKIKHELDKPHGFCQVPGRSSQLPDCSPHRSVREGFPHTVPQS